MAILKNLVRRRAANPPATSTDPTGLCGFTDRALEARLRSDPTLLADLDAAATAITAGQPIEPVLRLRQEEPRDANPG